MIGVPLLRDGDILGILVLHRTRAVPFTEKQIELVETFADQAVIAIENTRLFEAEQASKRELQESLEYQTAIGDVLDVISRSPTRLQQVLDTIAKSAARLCDAEAASIFRRDDGRLLFAAHQSTAAWRNRRVLTDAEAEIAALRPRRALTLADRVDTAHCRQRFLEPRRKIAAVVDDGLAVAIGKTDRVRHR
jgi:hypothetical protein